MIPVTLLKFFGPAVRYLSPGRYPDSKQPLGVVMLIPAKSCSMHTGGKKKKNNLNPSLKEQNSTATCSFSHHPPQLPFAHEMGDCLVLNQFLQ